MTKAPLYYAALPFTQEVVDILNFLSIPNVQYPSYMKFTEGCGLFIYNNQLELEVIDADTEWLLETKDAIQVLAYYANKDFNGLCTYLNTIPERPFNVFIDSAYLT